MANNIVLTFSLLFASVIALYLAVVCAFWKSKRIYETRNKALEDRMEKIENKSLN